LDIFNKMNKRVLVSIVHAIALVIATMSASVVEVACVRDLIDFNAKEAIVYDSSLSEDRDRTEGVVVVDGDDGSRNVVLMGEITRINDSDQIKERSSSRTSLIDSDSTTSTSTNLIRLSTCDCYFAKYFEDDDAIEKRFIANAIGVGLRCDKEGYFIQGFENAGQYAGGSKEDRFVPLSRARCCRPCVGKDNDSDVLKKILANNNTKSLLNEDGTDVRVLSENCESASVISSSSSSSSSKISALSDNEAKCPLGTFATGFEHAAEANAASTSDLGNNLFFPTGTQTCCKPTILKQDDTKYLLQSCGCEKSSGDENGNDDSDSPSDSTKTSSVVSCGKNKLLRIFEHTIQASGSGRSNFEKPETVVTSPFECCSVCINPNNGDIVQPDCGKHGMSVMKDYGAYGCSCDEGYFGESCELISNNDDGLAIDEIFQDPSVAFSLILIGIIFGCCARNSVVARQQRLGRRFNDALLNPLLVNGENRRPGANNNDFDFEASDLSTSSDEEEDDDDDSNNNSDNNNADSNDNEHVERDEESGMTTNAEDGPRTARRKRRNKKKKKIDQGLISASDNEEEEERESIESTDGEETFRDAQSEQLTTRDDEHDTLIRKAKGKKFSECALCLDAPVQAVLIPCGHACCCRKCCRRLRRCPICRVVIERRQKLYLGGS